MLLLIVFYCIIIFYQHEFYITKIQKAIQTNEIGSYSLKNRCFAPNFSNYHHDIAMDYVKVWNNEFRQYFNMCPINEKDNFELDGILEISQSSINNDETYTVKLNIGALESYLNKVNKSFQQNYKCYMQNIWKKDNKPEIGKIHDLKFGEKYVFTSNTLTLKNFGHYVLKCLNERNEVFEYVYTIWPLNMTLAQESGYKDKQSVLKLIEPLNNVLNTFLIKDSEFNECGSLLESNTNDKRMNVLMIGIDSVSYNNMQRVFPLTYNYLKELENNVIFDNYNSIGENTYPNHMAILGGLKDPEMSLLYSLIKNNSHHDHFPFIWKQFEKLGYVSMLYLDYSKFSIFHNGRNGFLYKPTDFYNHALGMKLSMLSNSKNQHCIDKMPMYRIIFDKIEEFVTRMNSPINKDTPYFSFSFQTSFSHDFLTPPPGIDTRIRDMLTKIYSKGYLDDTMLIIYSDHGQRIADFATYTEMGRYERYRPFLSIRLPNKFKNSVYMQNLENNKHKLATHFDLYQTLQHFRVLNKNKADLNSQNQQNSEECRKQFRINSHALRNNRGISLLEELSDARTCDEASIDFRYCRCYNKILNINKEEFKSVTGYNFQFVVDLILNKLNNMIEEQKLCMMWKFDSLDTLKVKTINTAFNIYEVIIVVEPGKAMFEVNLFLNANKKLEISGNPTRLNYYGDEPKCIKNVMDRPYCYCISFYNNTK